MKTKLEMYKTAFAPAYGKYVAILKVRYDDNGKAILDCRMEGNVFIMFREEELTNFVL